MKTIKSIAVAVALLGVLAGSVHAQIISGFGGVRSAYEYAYGWPGVPAPGLAVQTGNSATGSATITLVTGTVSASNITSFSPLSTTTPIYVGFGANQELVTPTAVSGCGAGQPLGSCQVTASWTKLHGPSEPVFSGTFGLQEAINAANSAGGGRIAISTGWTGLGGTNATITAATPYPNVGIEDNRQSALAPYWSMQPSTLTSLATPATQTASTIVFTSATGTWAASATYFCVTYIDALGGESPCSLTYNQTPTVNYTLTVVSPAASTGAVGWRMYAGTSSVALAYLLPITSTACTLTTLETVVPACAIGANGTWAATFTTTTSLAPLALGVTNTANPVPQGHTTFAYQPSAEAPVPFQTMFGPFGTGTIASATAAAQTILGSFHLPAGYQNYIGRTVRVTGKILLTAGASSTLSIILGTAWAGGTTAGVPVTVCNAVSGFVFATQPYTSTNFSCTMTTNAVGATAIGSLQPESWFMSGYAAGTLIPVGTETSNAAIGSLGLFAQNEYSVILVPSVAADTTVRLLSLHIETLQ